LKDSNFKRCEDRDFEFFDYQLKDIGLF